MSGTNVTLLSSWLSEWVEPVGVEYAVEDVEVSGVVGDDRSRPHHRLVTVECRRRPRVRRQRPQEPGQSTRVTRLLQSVAHLGHLLGGQPQQLLPHIIITVAFNARSHHAHIARTRIHARLLIERIFIA